MNLSFTWGDFYVLTSRPTVNSPLHDGQNHANTGEGRPPHVVGNESPITTVKFM